jgi:hypothetical protein
VHLFAPMGKTTSILNFFGMMAGTTRLELATSAVTAFLGFTTSYKTRGDCQTTRKSCKTSYFVGWVVGWELPSACRPCTARIIPGQVEMHSLRPTFRRFGSFSLTDFVADFLEWDFWIASILAHLLAFFQRGERVGMYDK